MRSGMKKLFALLLLLVFSFCLASAAFADDDILGLTPDWFPEDLDNWQQFHCSPSAPRVIDRAGILNPQEEELIEQRIRTISADTGKDIAVYTDVTAYGWPHEIFADDVYDFLGFGLGDDYSGLVLVVIMDPADRGFATSAGGSVQKLFNEKNANELDDILYDHFVQGAYGAGVLDWVDHVENLYTTGEVNPVPLSRRVTTAAIISAIVGLLGGSVTTGAAGGKMRTVTTAYSAQGHLVPGSFRAGPGRDILVNHTVNRIYDPPQPKSSGSSGGSSSYSSHSSGHSSVSHSSSSRKF